MTQIEVRHYRDNLHQYIAEIRNPKTPSSRLQGVWETWAGHKSITIQEVGAGVYRAHGIAVDNPDKEAPNLGLFDVISKGFSKEIVVRDGGIYINLKLEGNRLLAVDQSEFGSFGAGVTFNGNYEKSDKLVEAPEIDL